MSVNSLLKEAMLNSIASFIPSSGWFEQPGEGAVWVSGYRVHRVPLDGRLETDFLQCDFEHSVRAVFIEVELPYPNFLIRVNPREDGQWKDGTKLVGWETSEKGIVLLLITPFPLREGPDAGSKAQQREEMRAWERLDVARSIVVVTLGRNAAYEQIFGVSLELGTGSISASTVSDNPMWFPPPVLEGATMMQMREVDGAINSADEGVRNRVRLALRWYQRALGDRLASNLSVSPSDRLLNYWVALEILTRSGEKGPTGAILGQLASIHGLTTQKAGETFPISGVYQIRREIVHQGYLAGVDGGLLGFLSDVFFDVLVSVLEFGAPPRTQRWLDGSANEFVRRWRAGQDG